MAATFTPETPTVSSLSDFMLFEKQEGEKLAFQYPGILFTCYKRMD